MILLAKKMKDIKSITSGSMRCFLILMCFTASVASRAADESTHWTYHGEHGPENWGDLSEDYIQCKVGLNQSPIDIVDSVEADLGPLVLDYNSSTIDLVNNGHTAQMNVAPGSYMRVEGEEFELLQFHIHVPSEHWVNGKQSLLEVHYVHRNKNGQLAVLGVLHDEGEDPPLLQRFMPIIPTQAGQSIPFELATSSLAVVNADKAYYRYNGSLTTPPCSEGVRWYVLKAISPVSKARRDAFHGLIGDDARGPQPINARPVLR